MKSKLDPRHQRRIKNMQMLFAYDAEQHNQLNSEQQDIVSKLDQIDQHISVNAPKWPIDQINKIDLAILRLSIWELLYNQSVPPKVVVDEAVEIAKEFGTETSFGFVNGVLGSVIKTISPDGTSNSSK
ncbi:MAG TPA: transcription antitermination factor NusB [Candidatus Woesebacteria bacterium]|nr:transcription antitermination factor NusB [Candidatus Woesebacteria bacterium]